jgi:hypothetical protein
MKIQVNSILSKVFLVLILIYLYFCIPHGINPFLVFFPELPEVDRDGGEGNVKATQSQLGRELHT